MENILTGVTGFIMIALALFMGTWIFGVLEFPHGTGIGWDPCQEAFVPILFNYSAVCDTVVSTNAIAYDSLVFILIIIAAAVIIQAVKLFKEAGAKK